MIALVFYLIDLLISRCFQLLVDDDFYEDDISVIKNESDCDSCCDPCEPCEQKECVQPANCECVC